MPNDLINRTELLEQIESLRVLAAEDNNKWRVTANAVIECIKLAKPVKPETTDLKHGYWEMLKTDALVYWRCTVCMKCHYVEEPRDAFFCPACGGRMDEAPKPPHKGAYFPLN